jgi:peptidoglycan-N-acetylglucosamine deacetylase
MASQTSHSQIRPFASVSLDLDDKWTYMKTHGDARWTAYPSYLSIVVPRVLQFLEEQRLKITFFIVGQDAAFEYNHPLLRSITDAGHDVGNHSYHHEPWLHLYSEADIQKELQDAEAAIEQATGVRPKGFRGPGFSVSESVVRVLSSRGYHYDASTLPTFLGPLARAYYFLTAKLDAEEKRKRAKLFGAITDGFRPLKTYKWRAAECSITEIPVTTMPVLRTPFHLSYLLYVSTYSTITANIYARTAFSACRWARVNPSFLLHPLDFWDLRKLPSLHFSPA